MIIFDEERHEYWLGEKQLPSVTQIVGSILDRSFDHIPQNILRAKAEFGTRVHLACELYSTIGLYQDDLPAMEQSCLDEWVKLIDGFEHLQSEQIVHYLDRYAGTFDILAKKDKEVYLIDIKTTYELDVEYLQWQLSYYRMAYQKMTGKRINKLMAAWLPKGKLGEMIEVDPINSTKLLHALKKYEGLV